MNAPLTSRQGTGASGQECPVARFDHLELFVGNARQAARYYESAFGFQTLFRRGLETGSRDAASYVLQQGRIRLVLTSALSPAHPAARSVLRHGDGVAVIALETDDAAATFERAVAHGAHAAFEPRTTRDESGELRESGVKVYGDTVLKFVERCGYHGGFAPGFVALPTRDGPHEGVGLGVIDHVVANVPEGEMQAWANFFEQTLGFSELTHFDREAISTKHSALQSVVMQDPSGRIKFPINEPAPGLRKSQIAEFLDYHHGPGVQHIACATGNIIKTVSQLRDRGVRFLQVPPTYYEALEARVGTIAEPIGRLAELGILVDREADGYLLQIFTEPVEDRPTLFYEIIQRRGGARGFGEGNFKALFEAIERQQASRGNL